MVAMHPPLAKSSIRPHLPSLKPNTIVANNIHSMVISTPFGVESPKPSTIDVKCFFRFPMQKLKSVNLGIPYGRKSSQIVSLFVIFLATCYQGRRIKKSPKIVAFMNIIF